MALATNETALLARTYVQTANIGAQMAVYKRNEDVQVAGHPGQPHLPELRGGRRARVRPEDKQKADVVEASAFWFVLYPKFINEHPVDRLRKRQRLPAMCPARGDTNALIW